jgi:hypothetical protein
MTTSLIPTSWIVGAGVAVLGLLGLTMAAKSVDLGTGLFGWLLFVFAIAFDFWLIKLAYDRQEEQSRG